MYMLDEFLELATEAGVKFYILDQCMYGSDFEKKTDLLSNIEEQVMQPLRKTFDRPGRWWIIPWNGDAKYAPPPTVTRTPETGRRMGGRMQNHEENTLPEALQPTRQA